MQGHNKSSSSCLYSQDGPMSALNPLLCENAVHEHGYLISKQTHVRVCKASKMMS